MAWNRRQSDPPNPTRRIRASQLPPGPTAKKRNCFWADSEPSPVGHIGAVTSQRGAGAKYPSLSGTPSE
eukprot:11618471-Alexandrium_andersonii.AAC.1